VLKNPLILDEISTNSKLHKRNTLISDVEFTTGRALFAEGQKPSAKASPRAALGKGLSGNF